MFFEFVVCTMTQRNLERRKLSRLKDQHCALVLLDVTCKTYPTYATNLWHFDKTPSRKFEIRTLLMIERTHHPKSYTRPQTLI